ncbi:MAG: metallophosphoesterase [Candidatus Pacebacteria bacterium]|nr:metallophosphoesterase [Candidatus Paceibacterota bacterium]
MKFRLVVLTTLYLTIIYLSTFFTVRVVAILELFDSSLLHILTIVGVVVPIILVITMSVGYRTYNKINTGLYTVSVVWLGLVLYAFMATIVVVILFLLQSFTFIHLPLTAVAQSVYIFSTMCVAYSIVHAHRPKIVSVTVKSEQLYNAWNNKTIVLISDTHIGPVRREKFLALVVKKINSLHPDIVFIAGDIIDGPVFSYEKVLAPLRDLKTTLGVYYTPGNHEGYNSEPEKFYPIIQELTTAIVDQRIIINNTQIVGLDFCEETATRICDRLEKTGFDTQLPSIALLHDPKHSSTLMKQGVSLVLSGHTHYGQFFPMNLMVRAFYKKFSYGLNYEHGNASITSCGVGTAMMPMRLGTTPEIVVVKITK